jgi:16S rRNA (guanine(966)-N(2))-methyltransferase RsmD
VLDLYGGSGALALEALSLGAESAVIVDLSAKACQCIQENIDTLNCRDRARLLRMKDTAALAALQKQGDAFDLIFLDPPYRMDTAPICAAIMEMNLLRQGGKVIVEHSKETPPKAQPPLTLIDRREYGVAGLSFYKTEGEDG